MTPRITGTALVALLLLTAVFAPVLAPNDATRQFRDLSFAPPMPIRIVDAGGRLHAPFVYPLELTSRLERTYEADHSRRLPLRWLSDGRLVRVEGDRPLLLLGADSLGRDVLSRLILGARWSLGGALVAALGALLVGALVGGVAGYAGGVVDELLMRSAEFVLVLPMIYVVLTLRALLPLVLPAGTVFVLLSGLLALVGWPWVARGVRTIVATEATREYASAARSLGSSHARVLWRHLLPATRGFLLVQATLLVPAFVVAEATLSFVGLGFPEPTPSWGAMLRESSNIRALAEFPWLLAPAAAIVLVTLGTNLATQAVQAHGPTIRSRRVAGRDPDAAQLGGRGARGADARDLIDRPAA